MEWLEEKHGNKTSEIKSIFEWFSFCIFLISDLYSISLSAVHKFLLQFFVVAYFLLALPTALHN